MKFMYQVDWADEASDNIVITAETREKADSLVADAIDVEFPDGKGIERSWKFLSSQES